MAEKVGAKMRAGGWKGLFGIDVIKDEERNELRLLEINARQTASVTYESFLQEKNRANGLKGKTIFEKHLEILTDSETTSGLIQINDGSQIIQRVTRDSAQLGNDKMEQLKKDGFNVIAYENKNMHMDLIRIQSEKGLLSGHDKLNERGKKILEILWNQKA